MPPFAVVPQETHNFLSAGSLTGKWVVVHVLASTHSPEPSEASVTLRYSLPVPSPDLHRVHFCVVVAWVHVAQFTSPQAWQGLLALGPKYPSRQSSHTAGLAVESATAGCVHVLQLATPLYFLPLVSVTSVVSPHAHTDWSVFVAPGGTKYPSAGVLHTPFGDTAVHIVLPGVAVVV
ncbi:Hypothetical protein GL50581_196 [Giardia duodenalis ATCC 50581]|uniref:Uncharacterized protein n=1 Tax=Giardia intestinalis (strain ATCC 50581 / GS clone H7) TaxID=598745 RepID=C6LN94_GIAIB|nr:Hypothetical protein GL50581_196 [Giardia intestinalis ATCC 50581]